jgi:trimeric autotransporter adhesin
MTEIVRCPLRTIALASLLLGIGLASPCARAQQRVGVDSAVNPAAMGIPPGALPRRLVLGQDVVFNERITTEAGGQTQILFVDESTLSVGPNANMVIDQFVYDPNTGTGKFAASLTRGVFRFVGGKLSKQDNAVTMRTPTATIGIRGVVMLADVAADGRLTVDKVYGKSVTITGLNGVSQTITGNGFEVTVSGPGASPSDPAKTPPGATVALNNQLDGRSSGNGGATTIPTEVTVANSGIANTISANVTASIQAAAHTQPPVQQSQNVSPVVQLTQLNNQNVSVPGATVTPVGGGPSVAIGDFPIVQPGTPIPNSTPIATPPAVIPATPPAVIPATPPAVIPVTPPVVTPPVVTPQPVVITVAGLAKVSTDPPTTSGFSVQTPAYRIPYANGTITHPPGSVLQSGTFAAAFGNTGPVTLAPLTPGSTNAVTATAANGATVTGTATMTTDGNFFYPNLTANNGVRLFVFGGVPVNQSFYAPTATNRFYAFTINPDAALASATSPQTIPFLPSNYGGTLPVLPGNVSPVYLTASPNQQFGSYNADTNPSGGSPHFLQASLAVNGQRGSQSSALVVATGTFSTSNAGSVAASGPVRGTVFTSATAPLVRIDSGLATVADGNGNNLFGGKNLSGFVLDQNQYNGGNFSLHTASASPFTPPSSATFSYGFNQPVTAANLPSGVCTTAACRPQLFETGYFGGDHAN